MRQTAGHGRAGHSTVLGNAATDSAGHEARMTQPDPSPRARTQLTASQSAGIQLASQALPNSQVARDFQTDLHAQFDPDAAPNLYLLLHFVVAYELPIQPAPHADTFHWCHIRSLTVKVWAVSFPGEGFAADRMRLQGLFGCSTLHTIQTGHHKLCLQLHPNSSLLQYIMLVCAAVQPSNWNRHLRFQVASFHASTGFCTLAV